VFFSCSFVIALNALSAAGVAAVACYLGDVLIDRFAAMVTAVFVVTAHRTAATLVGAFSIVSHNYLRSIKPNNSRVLFCCTWTLTQFARPRSVSGHT
jgi:putative exporter of polyketide antibiotics